MTEPKEFFTNSDWQDTISNERYKKIDILDESKISQVEKERSIVFLMDFKDGDQRLDYDGHIWDKSSKKDGYRHKPVYKKVEINGEKCFVVQCISFDNAHFRKEILVVKSSKFIRYFLSQGTYPTERMIKKKRLTAKEASEFQNLLAKRTVKDAKCMAEENGLILTSKQASNQVRLSKNAIVGNTGPKFHISYEDLLDLENKNPDDVFIQSTLGDPHLEFVVTRLNKCQIKIFLARCPSKDLYNDWISSVNSILKSDLNSRKQKIAKMSSELSFGFKFANRVFIDTTFNVGHLYLTQILGEIDSFETKQSGKLRTVTLGVMLHTNKKQETHMLFAKKIRRAFREISTGFQSPVLTSIYMDGESSLLQYSKILKTPPLRCDFHLFAQFSRMIGRVQMNSQKKYIFGEMSGVKWKRGLLGAFDKKEFDKKLECLKNVINVRLYNWLLENRQMLLECSIIRAKLRAGHILQYGTNNSIEAVNGKLKVFIKKPRSLAELFQSLNHYSNDELKEVCKAAGGFPDIVRCTSETRSLSTEEKQMLFVSLGLPSARFLSWEVPSKLFHNTDFALIEEMFKKADELEIISNTEKVALLEDQDKPDDSEERIVTVRKLATGMICSVCSNQSYFCKHTLIVLQEMSEMSRRTELLQAERQMFPPKTTLNPKSGHKQSDRIGSRASASNHHRAIQNISELSIFDSQLHNITEETTIVDTLPAERASNLFDSNVDYDYRPSSRGRIEDDYDSTFSLNNHSPVTDRENIYDSNLFSTIRSSHGKENTGNEYESTLFSTILSSREENKKKSEEERTITYDDSSNFLDSSIPTSSSQQAFDSPLANSTMTNGNIRTSKRKRFERSSSRTFF